MHGQRLLRLVCRLVPDAGEAEEVLQDALLRALRNLESFDAGRGSLASWLSTIAWRTALNHLRLHRRPFTLSLETVGQDLTAVNGNAFEAEEEMLDAAFSSGQSARIEALTKALQQLSADDRTLLRLRYTDELPLDEIASAVGTNTTALASRLYRIRKKLYNLILKIEQQ
jgi:RNA polymerase sigma-70 factor (ECF subfamily)